MKRKLFFIVPMLLLGLILEAQEVGYEEYNLDNGLHVILHQDNKAPVITVGVMYHIGSKDEEAGKTGFAHFFEHLLFERTENIEKGKWFDIVASNGGRNNANTTQDRTYYYETFPSNNLELGLWMESERMLHPIIDKGGVETQNEVIKEEKRQRIDNAPYGKIIYRTGINKYIFTKHPYKQSVIGSMNDLDSAELEEFLAFNKKYYNPNNAVLVVAGDIESKDAKKMIADYFGPIQNNAPKVNRTVVKEDPITEEIKAKEYDANIQLPVKALVYRTPKRTDKDSYVFDYISTVLTGGNSSRMYKKMVEEKKMALQVLAFTDALEDYGAYIMGALPLGDTSLEKLEKEMQEEIEKLQNELITEREFEKLQNQFENNFVNSNASIEGVAGSLATYYMLQRNTNLINEEINIYRSITREDIQRVAKQYLNKNQRLNLDYLPESSK